MNVNYIYLLTYCRMKNLKVPDTDVDEARNVKIEG